MSVLNIQETFTSEQQNILNFNYSKYIIDVLQRDNFITHNEYKKTLDNLIKIYKIK